MFVLHLLTSPPHCWMVVMVTQHVMLSYVQYIWWPHQPGSPQVGQEVKYCRCDDLWQEVGLKTASQHCKQCLQCKHSEFEGPTYRCQKEHFRRNSHNTPAPGQTRYLMWCRWRYLVVSVLCVFVREWFHDIIQAVPEFCNAQYSPALYDGMQALLFSTPLSSKLSTSRHCSVLHYVIFLNVQSCPLGGAVQHSTEFFSLNV